MPSKAPAPPAELRTSGRALWRAVLADYDLDAHERTILREACRTADALDGLQELLDTEGLMGQTSQGPRVHPALVEARQQRMTFARLVAALAIPASDQDDRRHASGAPRGVYQIGAVS